MRHFMKNQHSRELPLQTEMVFPEKLNGVRRKICLAVAFVLAGISDLLSIWLETLPPIQWLLDLVTAGMLFMLLGRQWMILPGLIAEAIPGLALFPSWLLVVGSISAWGTIQPRKP